MLSMLSIVFVDQVMIHGFLTPEPVSIWAPNRASCMTCAY